MLGIDPTSSHVTRGRVIEALSRIRAEYNELPGLCLTPAEAQRLVGLEQHECVQLFAAMLDTGYLRRSVGGFTRS
jgi:hypothetical protein